MCGRFANQQESREAWEQYFDTPLPSEFFDEVDVGYNVAPTQTIPVMTNDGWVAARWGMIAPWATEISTKYSTFNARSETVKEKATFKHAWNHNQRCLIPAIGYFEWQTTEDGKQPYFATFKHAPFCFAGLYEPARKDIPCSCTIITLPASSSMSALHHRMPLMFGTLTTWLESDSFSGHLDSLSWHAVDKAVNNPKNQGSKLINTQ